MIPRLKSEIGGQPDLDREKERPGDTSQPALVSFLSRLFTEEKKNALDTNISQQKVTFYIFSKIFNT